MDITITKDSKKENRTKKIPTITAPPSKSIAHRAIICSCLAKGESVIRNIAFSDDINATICAMENAGASVIKGKNELRIKGIGNKTVTSRSIFCNESGSSLRFLIPVFSALSNPEEKTIFSGKGRLMSRPQSVFENIFRQRGIEFSVKEDEISVGGGLKGGTFTLPGDVSSQFISGLLFALPLLNQDSIIKISSPLQSKSYVDLTVMTLAKFGITITFSDENTIFVKGNQTYKGIDFTVEGDFSQVAFWAVLGCAFKDVAVIGTAPDSLQGDRKIIDFLTLAGGNIIPINGGYLFKKSHLHGITTDLQNCPDLGPILTVLSCFSAGQSQILNTKRLKIKESDRATAMKIELEKLSCNYFLEENKIIISGINAKNTSQKVVFNGHQDHRIVMSIAIAGILAELDTFTVKGVEYVAKSYPDFFDQLQSISEYLTIKMNIVN